MFESGKMKVFSHNSGLWCKVNKLPCWVGWLWVSLRQIQWVLEGPGHPTKQTKQKYQEQCCDTSVN